MTAKVDQTCSEIARCLLDMDNPTREDARKVIRDVCLRLSPERIPRKQEILAAAGSGGYSRLRRILLKKPAKTGSGVAVVALMPMPYACPHGRCTYCPGGISANTPNSYTGAEPSALNAIENGYDPYRQITTKIGKLVAYGHNPTKMELVIVGGTFLFMPRSYRDGFIKSCYDALNGTVSGSLESAKALNERSRIRNRRVHHRDEAGLLQGEPRRHDAGVWCHPRGDRSAEPSGEGVRDSEPGTHLR